MMILNINTTSTTKTLTLCGTPIKLDGSTVLLRDFNTLSNYASKADFENEKGNAKERSWNYIQDSSGKNRADENLYDIKLTSSKDGKTIDLFNRWHGRKTFKLTDTNEIETTIRLWNEEALGNSDRKFVAANSAIKGDLSSKVSRPAETSDSSSGDDTVKPLSWLYGAKAPKVATTFMGQTLIAGSTKDVVEFKGNSAYNISVSYDSETGYTVKAPIRGITENGKVFKNAKDAQRAIAKYETAIKKHLEKTKKPEQNANPYAKALKTPNLLNVFDPNFKINGLEEYKMPDTKGVKGFDPNFKIEGLDFKKYKIPATNSTKPLFQTD
jgi:hypothetical protein